MMIKQYLETEIYEIVRLHCKSFKVVSILSLFSESWNQNTNCVSYYDDVICCERHLINVKRCVNK